MSRSVNSKNNPTDLFLSLLGRLHIPVIPTDDPFRFLVHGQPVTLHTRSLPSSTERLLEPIILHAMRQRTLVVSEDVLLVIVVPQLPSTWHQLVDDVGMLLGGPLRLHDARQVPTSGRWVIVSELGGCIINGLSGVESSAHPDTPGMLGPRSSPSVIQQKKDPRRSDIAMCILKLLFARAIQGSEAWCNTQHLGFTTTSALARSLAISESAAYGIISDLQSRQWVAVDKKHGPQLVQAPEVAEWWLMLARTTRHARIALRPLYPSTQLTDPGERLEWLRTRTEVPGCHWAVNGWTACDLHQQSFLMDSTGKPCCIALVGTFAQLARAWELVICDDPLDARAFLQIDVVEHPRSVLVGRLTLQGLPCVDLWQAALDVVSDQDHGLEQARAIMEYLLSQLR